MIELACENRVNIMSDGEDGRYQHIFPSLTIFSIVLGPAWLSGKVFDS